MNNTSKAWLVTAAAASVAVMAGLLLPADAYLGMVAALFLLAAGSIALMVQFEAPFLGLAVLVLTAVAFPIEFRGPAGVMMGSSFPFAAVLCGVWLLHLALVRRFSLDGSRVVYAAVAFMGIAILSFVVGQFPWFPSGGAPIPAQLAEMGLILLSGLLFLAVGHQLHSMNQLKWLTWILIGAGAVTCILQVIPSLAFVGRWTTRPGSVGSLFWTWLVALSVAQALFNRTLSVTTRVCLFGVTALVLYHGLFQVRSWASGWVPPVIALGIIFLFRLPRVAIGTGLVVVPLAVFFSGDVLGALLGEEAYSLSTRQGAWSSLWGLVERSPLLGTGPANYYYLTENVSILGWYVRFISHNNYQDLLVQMGFVGLLGFAWFAIEALWMTLRVYRDAPAGFPRAYAIGALGGVAGSLAAGMLGDWIIPFYYNAGILGFRSSLLFWVFLGGVLAMKRMAASPAEAGAYREAVELGDADASPRGYRKLLQA